MFGIVVVVELVSYVLAELAFTGTTGAAALVVAVIVAALEFAVTAAYPAVMYAQLRQAKESVSVDEISPDWD